MLRVAGVGLYDYLAQQVMEKQPPDVQEFLLRTSLLEEFTAAFCAEVIGPALNLELNWDALMDAALRNNLFILPVDEELVTLRYHHLFLDFLQHRMQEQRPDEADQHPVAPGPGVCRAWRLGKGLPGIPAAGAALGPGGLAGAGRSGINDQRAPSVPFRIG